MTAWTQHSNHIGELTDRQKEVLSLIASGRTNPEIAGTLGVSLAGAKWHVSEVISRLGVETREEATEVWREEHALPRRFSNAFHGLIGLGTLKIALGVAAVGTVGAFAAGVIISAQQSQTGGDEPAVAAAKLPDSPNSIYSSAEAAAVGRELAAGVIVRDSRLGALTVEGRTFTPSELTFVEEKFFENATFKDVGQPGLASAFPTGRNLWTEEFVVKGFDTPTGPGDVRVTVLFEDGQSTLIESFMNTPVLPLPPEAHPPMPTEPLGTFEAGGISWTILGGTSGPPWALGVGSGQPNSPLRGVPSIEQGTAETGNQDLFGVRLWTADGFAFAVGGVSEHVGHVEIRTDDGRTATVIPQAPPAGTDFPYRVFGTALPGIEFVAEVHVFDNEGNELGTGYSRGP